MYINSLEARNSKLIDYAFHKDKEIILPNTYILDMDVLIENGKMMIEEAKLLGLDLFFMTKQLGRNPLACKKMMELGYKGAVVVDFQEALIMIENEIPIAHAGHLVQIPNGFLEKLLSYGVSLLTVFSIEKAKEINIVAEKLGIVQEICLKFCREEDLIYPGQNGGFFLEELVEKIKELQMLDSIMITTLTAFPCYLYDEILGKVLPVRNLETMKKAQIEVEKILGYQIKLNMPSCNQTSLLEEIITSGGNSAEPGSALLGMTPNNIENKAMETPAMVYLSEISHNFKGKSYCFGGGSYPRGAIENALVGNDYASARKIKVVQPKAENIDYYIELEEEGRVGETVLMLFRSQIFVTRSNVAVVSGIQADKPKLEGIFTSTGYRIS